MGTNPHVTAHTSTRTARADVGALHRCGTSEASHTGTHEDTTDYDVEHNSSGAAANEDVATREGREEGEHGTADQEHSYDKEHDAYGDSHRLIVRRAPG